MPAMTCYSILKRHIRQPERVPSVSKSPEIDFCAKATPIEPGNWDGMNNHHAFISFSAGSFELLFQFGNKSMIIPPVGFFRDFILQHHVNGLDLFIVGHFYVII